MKIAILGDPLDNQYAGIHIFTRWMIDALIKHDTANEYHIIRLKVDDKVNAQHQHAIPNVSVPFLYTPWRLAFQIPTFIKKQNFDVVIEPAHFGPLNIPKHIKRVTVIHDLTPITLKKYHRWHSQLLQGMFLKKILNRTDMIITNSNNSKNDIEMYFPNTVGKVNLIHLGKDDIFKPTIDKDFNEYHKLNKPYILFLGTIEPRKNLVTLLKAFQLFKEKFNLDIDLVIAGQKGWKTEAFDEAYNKHAFKNNIKILGYLPREDLPKLLSSAKVFVYPSIYEGFGLSVLEAMACGCPIIVSDNSSLPEVGGNAALYFNAMDAEALSEHLNTVCINDSMRNEMVNKSLEQAKKFSWDLFGKKMVELLNSLKS